MLGPNRKAHYILGQTGKHNTQNVEMVYTSLYLPTVGPKETQRPESQKV